MQNTAILNVIKKYDYLRSLIESWRLIMIKKISHLTALLFLLFFCFVLLQYFSLCTYCLASELPLHSVKQDNSDFIIVVILSMMKNK